MQLTCMSTGHSIVWSINYHPICAHYTQITDCLKLVGLVCGRTVFAIWRHRQQHATVALVCHMLGFLSMYAPTHTRTHSVRIKLIRNTYLFIHAYIVSIIINDTSAIVCLFGFDVCECIYSNASVAHTSEMFNSLDIETDCVRTCTIYVWKVEHMKLL